MKQKLTAWLLLAALLLTLTACASTKAPDDAQTSEDTTQEDTVTTPETDETDAAETPDVQPEDEDKSEETADPADETEDAQPEDNPDTQPEENTPSDETPETQPEVQPDPQPDQPADVSVDLAAVRTDIQTQLGITDALPLETDALLNLYGIDSSWVAQSASFVTMAGTFPDEVILVEAVDETAAASIQEKLQNRLNEVLVQSESYDPDNYKAAQSCSVRVNGCYVALILSPKQADMAAIYEGYVS